MPPWRRTWNELSARVEDDASARNNRFKVAADLNKLCRSAPPGPFWGGPATSEGPHFSLRDSPSPYPVDRGSTLQRLRETERRLPGVSPTWKLWGPGSVGGQTLLGIPAVARLRDDPAFQAISRVWPFETGFGLIPVPAGNPYILHIEIWPGVVNGKLDPAVKIKDQAQVRAMVKWLADLDAGDELLPLFSQPADLTGEKLARVRTEEGWIFGAR